MPREITVHGIGTAAYDDRELATVEHLWAGLDSAEFAQTMRTLHRLKVAFPGGWLTEQIDASIRQEGGRT